MLRKEERDSQRSKVYKAERAAGVMIVNSKPLPTVADVEAFADRVLRSAVARKISGGYRGVRVGDGRRCRAASGGPSKIVIPRWARTQWVVLHELAHTLHLRNHPREAFHGWRFCSIYLQIVRAFIGKAAHDSLKQQFKELGVKYREPKKRVLTDEQKAALRARLAAVRAAKAARAA